MPFPGSSLFPSSSLFPGTDSGGGGGSLSLVLGDRYEEMLRSSSVQWAEVDAYRGGVLVASSLPVVGGSVTDDSSSGVRRTLDLSLAPEPGLFDVLAPTGTRLEVRTVIRYPNGETERVPMGVFDVDVQRLGYAPDSNLTLTAPDKWARVQRARFLKPQPSVRTMLITQQIALLLRGALGSTEPVNVFASSTATVQAAVAWERDRDKTIEELAKSIGAYVSFDRSGVATIEDLPTLGVSATWLIDARPKGVLLSADRERNRQRTYNVVIAASEMADGTVPFEPQIVWDSDPDSPTYAGPDPINSPELAGPFGVVPYFYSSPLLASSSQAAHAARTILARVAGLNAQLSLTSVRNPKLDALDVIDVLLPPVVGESRLIERHIVDRVVHPLMPDGVQQVTGRSTRTDEFE